MKSLLLLEYLKIVFFVIFNFVIDVMKKVYKLILSIWFYGDCYLGNILWCDGFIFVDLDDCCMGFVI